MNKNVLYGLGTLLVIAVVGVALYLTSHHFLNNRVPKGPPVVSGTIKAVSASSITLEALNPTLPMLPSASLSGGTTSVTAVAPTSSDIIAIQGATTFRKEIPVDPTQAALDAAKFASTLATNKPGTPAPMPPAVASYQNITFADLVVGQRVSITLTSAGIKNGQGTAADVLLLASIPLASSTPPALPVLPPLPPHTTSR